MAITLDGSLGITSPLETVVGQFSSASTMGFKNRIINGAMGIWQRGTSFNLTGGYTYIVDRWANNYQTALYAQSSDVPTTSGLRYSVDVTTTAGNYNVIQQRIESYNCQDLVGQTITVSVWIKAISGTINYMSANLGYPSAQDNWNTSVAFSGSLLGTGIPSTSWTQYTATFTNLPAGVANGLSLTFNPTTTGACEIRYTGVQLEKGSTATSFDYRPYGTELSLCQRYYQIVTDYRSASLYASSSGIFRSGTVQFGINMRAAPTVSFTSTTVSNCTSINTDVSYATGVTTYCGGVTGVGIFNWEGTVLATAEL